MSRALVLMVVMILGLAGCAVQPPLPSQSDWAARQETLASMERWDLSGRISVRTDAEAVNGSLNWNQVGDQLEMGFRGPLGVGGFRLAGTPEQMLFEDSKGEQLVLDDPGSALATQLGWQVPLASLSYWIRAMPDPDMQADQDFETSGRLQRLRQDGWSVDYERYALQGLLAMPGRVTIQREGIRIRLVIDRWRLGPGQ